MSKPSRRLHSPLPRAPKSLMRGVFTNKVPETATSSRYYHGVTGSLDGSSFVEIATNYGRTTVSNGKKIDYPDLTSSVFLLTQTQRHGKLSGSWIFGFCSLIGTSGGSISAISNIFFVECGEMSQKKSLPLETPKVVVACVWEGIVA